MKAAALADHRAQDGPRAADHTDHPSIPENQRGPSSSAPTRTGAISSVTATTARCTLSPLYSAGFPSRSTNASCTAEPAI
jgi:hypothetical protein